MIFLDKPLNIKCILFLHYLACGMIIILPGSSRIEQCLLGSSSNSLNLTASKALTKYIKRNF